MDPLSLNERLSRIQTQWTMIFQAHQGDSAAASEAQRQLMIRYAGAVYRYLLGIHNDPTVAEDLAQEFALRFLRGDFRRASPERGRFRDFVKMALRRLVIDHHRRQQARPRAAAVEELALPDVDEEPPDSDRRFLESWREELLARGWEALWRIEREQGQPYHTVLYFRATHPEARSAELAEALSARLGRPVTAAWVRQMLHRARQKYADALLDEVRQSLDDPTQEELEEELVELGLLEYFRPALERRRQNP